MGRRGQHDLLHIHFSRFVEEDDDWWVFEGFAKDHDSVITEVVRVFLPEVLGAMIRMALQSGSRDVTYDVPRWLVSPIGIERGIALATSPPWEIDVAERTPLSSLEALLAAIEGIVGVETDIEEG